METTTVGGLSLQKKNLGHQKFSGGGVTRWKPFCFEKENPWKERGLVGFPESKKMSPSWVQKKCQGLHHRTGSRHCWGIRLEQKIGQNISQKNDGNVPSRKKWVLRNMHSLKERGVRTCFLDLIFRFDSILVMYLYSRICLLCQNAYYLLLKLFEWVAMAHKEFIFCLGAFCKRVDLIP